MKIPVLVTTTFADGSVQERTVDHDDREHRVWLGKHCFWAMRNGATVTTRPLQ